MEITLAGWAVVILAFLLAAAWLFRSRSREPAAAGCTVKCDCKGSNCRKSHIHCAFVNGPMGDPDNPNCSVSCEGQCDGTLPVNHPGLHSCTHGHPF